MSTKRWSELDVIKMLSGHSSRSKDKRLIKGIGDDCAIISPDSKLHYVITTDMLVDNVHFSSKEHPAYQLGRKCIAVNLSDIAAMGAEPVYALMSISLPNWLEQDWFEQWAMGMNSILDEFGCALIGGDTVRGEVLTMNVTLIGSITKNKAIRRDTAGDGESVFVSGQLGSAAAGLHVLQHKAELDKKLITRAAPLIQQHLDPLPDILCGEILAKSGMVTAMQDISDGLATDLAHICKESGIGALVEESLLPCHPCLPEICNELGCKLTDFQVSGGEDYHLLFTVARGRDEDLCRYVADHHGPVIYRIGSTNSERGVLLKNQDETVDITFRGFEH